MEIKSTLSDRSGRSLEVVYRDVESEHDFKDKKISGVHAYCFCGDKLLVVYSDSKGYWTPPGGKVEDGEEVSDAIRREVREEANMHVLAQASIGYQDISSAEGVISQARSVCLVEPYGPFVADPDGGEITKIELIDPGDYKKYFDWGDIGDHIMHRALEIKRRMQEN